MIKGVNKHYWCIFISTCCDAAVCHVKSHNEKLLENFFFLHINEIKSRVELRKPHSELHPLINWSSVFTHNFYLHFHISLDRCQHIYLLKKKSRFIQLMHLRLLQPQWLRTYRNISSYMSCKQCSHCLLFQVLPLVFPHCAISLTKNNNKKKTFSCFAPSTWYTLCKDPKLP